jgi:hypothetical protein
MCIALTRLSVTNPHVKRPSRTRLDRLLTCSETLSPHLASPRLDMTLHVESAESWNAAGADAAVVVARDVADTRCVMHDDTI